jgi:predicted nucleic acid-binding Zn ribbon protein
MKKPICPECNEEFVGRVDKKFCSDQCRNTYNNRQNSDQNNLVRNINNALRKNRRILQQLNPTDKAKVHKSKLVDKGFDFKLFTSIYTTKKGTTYYFCYEHGYLPIENDYYFLVINQYGKSEEKDT